MSRRLPQNTKRKRVILNTNHGILKKMGDVMIVPTVDHLLDNALSVLQNEIYALKKKTDDGFMLDYEEANIMTKYVDALVKLSKESRELAKSDDLSELTNEEIAKLASEILDLPKPTTGSEDPLN